MFFYAILSIYLLIVVSHSNFYTNEVSSQNLTTLTTTDARFPNIGFVYPPSPLLHSMTFKVDYTLENIPVMLLNDSRIRVTIWACEFDEGDSPVEVEHKLQILDDFIMKHESLSNVQFQMYESLTCPTINLNEFRNLTRVRIVLQILSSANSTLPPQKTSHIRSFMDEITLTRKPFIQPTIDIWQNDAITDDSSIGRRMFEVVLASLDRAQRNESSLSSVELELDGMSGHQFRHFMNNLGALLPVPVHYLEIGVFAGSTMISLLNNNEENVRSVVGIDTWDPLNFLGKEQGGMQLMKETFLNLLPQYLTTLSVNIIEQDCWQVRPHSILEKTADNSPINVYLFDGPHSEDDHYFALVNYFPALADTFIFLVDDWNFPFVRMGTETGLTMLADSLTIVGKIELLTHDTPDTKTLWHNGMAAFVITKNSPTEINVDVL